MLTYLGPRSATRDERSSKTADLIGALRASQRERGDVAALCQRLAAGVAQREREHQAALDGARRLWGDTPPQLPSPPIDLGGRREECAAAERQLADLDARIAELRDILRERLAREEAAIAAERAGCEADALALGERLAELRALTAPLLAFEGYPSDGGLLPL